MAGFANPNNEIPDLANIRYNFVIPPEEVAERKRNVQRSLFGGYIGDSTFDACHGEIILVKATQGGPMRHFNGSSIPVQAIPGMTVLNGAGDEGRGREGFYATYRYGGIVATEAKYDPDGGFSTETYPGDMVGTKTMHNNGPGAIQMGDLVMYEVPRDAEHARQMMMTVQGTPEGRILPYVRKYDPLLHSFSPQRMDYLRSCVTDSSFGNPHEDMEVNTYLAMVRRVQEVMALGAIAYRYVEGKGQGSVLTQNEMFRMDENGTQNILRMFGLLPGIGRNPNARKLVEDFAHTLLAYRPNSDPAPTANTPVASSIRNILKNWVSMLGQHYKNLDWDVKKRVIGKALSTAQVGAKFDIMLMQPEA